MGKYWLTEVLRLFAGFFLLALWLVAVMNLTGLTEFVAALLIVSGLIPLTVMVVSAFNLACLYEEATR